MADPFSIQMHYGGQIVRHPNTLYKGGKVSYIDCDPDLVSYFELKDMFVKLGCPTTSTMYYRLPGTSMNNGLQAILSDNDVLAMVNTYQGLPVVVLYVDNGPNGEFIDGPNEVEVGGGKGHEDGDESDDSYDPSWLDEDLEGINDDDIFAELENEDQAYDQGENAYAFNNGDKGQIEVDVDGWWSEPENEAELHSLKGSSEGDDSDSNVEFNEDVDMVKPELKVGMKFNTPQVFREALKEWNVQNGYDIKYIRNENARITAVCKHDCGWRIHASPMQQEKTFQIKSLNPIHKCGRSYDNHLVTGRYLSKKYLEQFRDDPNWKIEAMQRTVKRDIMVNVSRSKVYRAKTKAKVIIEGDYNKQYAKLWDYCETVRKFNPGSCMKIMVERPSLELQPRFERMYVRLSAQKDGFINGCRPIIGLDGCHLKGVCSGQLLAAVGRDGNNNMFPIAIAVVEAETRNSWSWFLTELLTDIGSVEEYGWTFISDRQKGLVETFEQLIPTAEHRYCLRHMYSNFKAKFKGKEMKDAMWKAASSGTVREFEYHMKSIQAMDPENQSAYNWLNSINPAFWSRSHFSTRSKCDILVNNLNESFNGYILEARDKPVITMIEWIRRKLMTRFQIKRAGIQKYEGPICPAIQDKLEKIKVEARNCFPTWAGDRKFEVDYYDTTHVVNLDEQTCGCRMWDLSGIPCKHAVSAIYADKTTPEFFVHPCYNKVTYQACYSYMIEPVPGQHDWCDTGLDPILPPFSRKQPGRPKKLRRRGVDEPRNPYKVSRKNNYITCKRCGGQGHNSRTCKTPTTQTSQRSNHSSITRVSRQEHQTFAVKDNGIQGQPSTTTPSNRPKLRCIGGKGGKGPRGERVVFPMPGVVRGTSLLEAALGKRKRME